MHPSSLNALWLVLILSRSASSQRMLRGAIPLLDTFGENLAIRQELECPSTTETVCPDQQGCCPIGVACTSSAGIPYCAEDCVGGPTCTGILAGFCCDFGQVCDYVSTGCADNTGVTFGTGPSLTLASVTPTFTGLGSTNGGTFSLSQLTTSAVPSASLSSSTSQPTSIVTTSNQSFRSSTNTSNVAITITVSPTSSSTSSPSVVTVTEQSSGSASAAGATRTGSGQRITSYTIDQLVSWIFILILAML